MSNYTAGPWLISETGPKYSINAGNGGASTRHIAMVSCFQQYEGDSRENIANAYLIAAAPELLEALYKLLAATVDEDLKYGITLTEAEEEARALALAAIAKTVGEDDDQ